MYVHMYACMYLYLHLKFQFKGIIVSPDRRIPPFGTKISKPAEHNVMRTIMKKFTSVSLRATVHDVTSISIPHSQIDEH